MENAEISVQISSVTLPVAAAGTIHLSLLQLLSIYNYKQSYQLRRLSTIKKKVKMSPKQRRLLN